MPPIETALRCRTCVQPLEAEALACPRCHSLVHEEQLERIAAEAKQFAAQSQWRAARDRWLTALPMLPADSEQAAWIRSEVQQLLNKAVAAEAPSKQSKWAKRLGPLAPAAALLAKVKSVLLVLFKLKFLLSFAAFIAVYWALLGPKFGLGIAGLILIHEMGHFIDVKRRGLPAEMPVFVPGIGAYVRWDAMGVPLEARAAVSLAGPLSGGMACAACFILWWKTGGALWAALAQFGAWLSVFNLIPVWFFDGGSAAMALGRTERALLCAASVALWCIVGNMMFLLVALGAVYRLFTRDLPERPSKFIAAYYLLLLVGLGAVLYAIPANVLPMR